MIDLEDEIRMVEETGGWVDPDIRKGPPVPSILPAKGVGIFREGDGLKFFTLSKFNTSDTVVRTPVTFKNAAKLFFNLFSGRNRE